MTNCINCKKSNEEGANFCNNCGMNLTNFTFNKNPDAQLSDVLLLVFLIISVVAAIAQFIIQRFYIDWYEAPVRYVQGFFWILQNISFILIPISIRNMPIKIAGIIITAILIIYWIYTNIHFMLR